MSRLQRVTNIMIHHSATEDGLALMSWEAIRAYHTKTKGWADIGYHYGAEYIRNAPVVLVGRPETFEGAHTLGHNDHTIGFCFVGDYDEITPPSELLQVAARRILAPLCLRHNLRSSDLLPHSYYASHKTCPGKEFPMDILQNLVSRELGKSWA